MNRENRRLPKRLKCTLDLNKQIFGNLLMIYLINSNVTCAKKHS